MTYQIYDEMSISLKKRNEWNCSRYPFFLTIGGPIMIHISNLRNAEEQYSVRGIDLSHVNELKAEFEKSYCPVPMIANVRPGDATFTEMDLRSRNVTSIQVLGGNHSLAALKLLKSDICVPVQLYCGLDRDECLKVALAHNAMHDFGKKTTFEDLVLLFRRLWKDSDHKKKRKTRVTGMNIKIAKVMGIDGKAVRNKLQTHTFVATAGEDLWLEVKKCFKRWKTGVILNGGKPLRQTLFQKLKLIKTTQKRVEIMRKLNNGEINTKTFKKLCDGTEREEILRGQLPIDMELSVCSTENDRSEEYTIRKKLRDLERRNMNLGKMNLDKAAEIMKLKSHCAAKEEEVIELKSTIVDMEKTLASVRLQLNRQNTVYRSAMMGLNRRGKSTEQPIKRGRTQLHVTIEGDDEHNMRQLPFAITGDENMETSLKVEGDDETEHNMSKLPAAIAGDENMETSLKVEGDDETEHNMSQLPAVITGDEKLQLVEWTNGKVYLGYGGNKTMTFCKVPLGTLTEEYSIQIKKNKQCFALDKKDVQDIQENYIITTVPTELAVLEDDRIITGKSFEKFLQDAVRIYKKEYDY